MGSLDSNFPAKPHHFFKIILSDIVPDCRLMIPQKFIKNYGEKLEDRVFLRVPTDAIWQVELERSNGEVWLHKGLQEFAACYSLCFGHLLVFQYEGNSHFNVLIFDASAFEIDYPVSTTHSGGCQVQKVQENAETSSNKRMRIEHSDEHDNATNQDANGFSSQSGGVQDKRMKPTINLDEDLDSRGSEQGGRANGLNGLRSASEVEKAGALTSAKAFKSNNPFFMVTIRPSYVTPGKDDMAIPKTFMERYITKDNGDINLGRSGRTWPVKCTLYSSSAKFRTGWLAFARDNDLCVGDVCVFELINGTEKLLNVFVFRAEKNANALLNKKMRTKSADEVEKASALSLAKAFNSENPFFMVTIHPSYITPGEDDMSIPKTFVGRYITKDNGNINLDRSGRIWPVKCTVYSQYAKFGTGWFAFAQDNNLSVGDVCIFELVNNTEKLLKVYIFRAKNANASLNKKTRTKSTGEAEKTRALASAKAFKSENPFFMVEMHPSYVAGKVNITVSKDFVKGYITKATSNVMLQLTDGRTWPAKCTLYQSNAKLSCGWTEFARDNDLAVGDVCAFELINPTENLLQVVIFRAAKATNG